MTRNMEPRQITAYECSHLRPVVQAEAGKWVHVAANGALGGECVAGVYVVQATYDGQHYLGDLVTKP